MKKTKGAFPNYTETPLSTSLDFATASQLAAPSREIVLDTERSRVILGGQRDLCEGYFMTKSAEEGQAYEHSMTDEEYEVFRKGIEATRQRRAAAETLGRLITQASRDLFAIKMFAKGDDESDDESDPKIRSTKTHLKAVIKYAQLWNDGVGSPESAALPLPLPPNKAQSLQAMAVMLTVQMANLYDAMFSRATLPDQIKEFTGLVQIAGLVSHWLDELFPGVKAAERV